MDDEERETKSTVASPSRPEGCQSFWQQLRCYGRSPTRQRPAKPGASNRNRREAILVSNTLPVASGRCQSLSPYREVRLCAGIRASLLPKILRKAGDASFSTGS